MPASAQPHGSSQPETPGVLLTAFRASLTGPGSAFADHLPSSTGPWPPTGPRPLIADVAVPTFRSTLAAAIELDDAAMTDDGDLASAHSPVQLTGLDDDDWHAGDPGPDLDVARLAELDPLTDADWQVLTGPP